MKLNTLFISAAAFSFLLANAACASGQNSTYPRTEGQGSAQSNSLGDSYDSQSSRNQGHPSSSSYYGNQQGQQGSRNRQERGSGSSYGTQGTQSGQGSYGTQGSQGSYDTQGSQGSYGNQNDT